MLRTRLSSSFRALKPSDHEGFRVRISQTYSMHLQSTQQAQVRQLASTQRAQVRQLAAYIKRMSSLQEVDYKHKPNTNKAHICIKHAPITHLECGNLTFIRLNTNQKKLR